MNPINAIIYDRTEARKVQDPNANTCFFALASTDGKASVRTLVLRDIIGNCFTLFINQTSPKWELLSSGADYEMLLWYPSQQKQYRIKGTTIALDPEVVKSNWFRRPKGSKLLDYVYESFGKQSSTIGSRNDLVQEINRIKENYSSDELVPPDQVAGIQLNATRIEMLDLNREDRIHDRRVYTKNNDDWQLEYLIP